MKSFFVLVLFLVFVSGCSQEDSRYPDSNYGNFIRCMDQNLYLHEEIKDFDDLEEIIGPFCVNKWSTVATSNQTRFLEGKTNLKYESSKLYLTPDLKFKALPPPNYIIMTRIKVRARISPPRIGVPGDEDVDEIICKDRGSIESGKVRYGSSFTLEGYSEWTLFLEEDDFEDVEIELFLDGKDLKEIINKPENICLKTWLDEEGKWISSDERKNWTWNIVEERYLNLNRQN